MLREGGKGGLLADVSYEPLAYWERRGADYRDPPPNLEDRDEVPNLVRWVGQANPESVLEVGSGRGRIYQAFQAAGIQVDFRMCDIAESMRRGCRVRTGVLPDPWDGVRLPYEDAAFDLVISFSVLLHVPPADLESHLCELARVARRRLFVATCTAAEGPLAPHCFLHDYATVLRRSDLTIAREQAYQSKGWTRTHWLLEKGAAPC